MGKRQAKRERAGRGREFLGEFIRYRCECGRTFEIQEPLAKAEFPGVRLYAGFCPKCGEGVLHGVCQSGRLEDLDAALSDFSETFGGVVRHAEHMH